MEFYKGLNIMRELTASNDNTRCYIIGCQILRKPAKNLLKKFQHIKALQELDGHIYPSLNDYRHRTYKDMMWVAQDNLSDEQFEEFYRATQPLDLVC